MVHDLNSQMFHLELWNTSVVNLQGSSQKARPTMMFPTVADKKSGSSNHELEEVLGTFKFLVANKSHVCEVMSHLFIHYE